MALSIGVIAGLITMLCWGVGDFFQAYAIKKIGSLKTLLGETIVGLLPLVTIAALNYDTLFISLPDLFLLIVGGIFSLVGVINFFKAFEIGEVSIVAPISATYSLITVILSLLFLGESLTLLSLFAVFVIIIGIILTSTDLRRIKHIHTVKGVSESLIAMVIFGIYFFILGYVSKHMNTINLFVFINTITSFLWIGYSLFRGTKITEKDLTTRYILLIFMVNAILYTLSWLSISYGITNDLVSLVTPVSSLSPAITVILAVVFLKEKLVFNQKLGILTILFGLFLISL